MYFKVSLRYGFTGMYSIIIPNKISDNSLISSKSMNIQNFQIRIAGLDNVHTLHLVITTLISLLFFDSLSSHWYLKQAKKFLFNSVLYRTNKIQLHLGLSQGLPFCSVLRCSLGAQIFAFSFSPGFDFPF